MPLLYSIYSSVEKHRNRKAANVLKRALGATIYSLSVQIGVPGQGVTVSGKNLVDNWKDEGRPALDEAFAKPFSELRKIPNALKPRRIVVLIDDLDRCSPGKVVSVLEAINLVMDVEGFIFVLALDYDVLVDAIDIEYPYVSGHDFVQKIIQLPFRVPRLSLKRPESLAELIPGWRSWMDTLPEDLPDHLRNISDLGLASNPRQIKRLINSFLVLRQIVIQRDLNTDLKFLATLLGIQLRWPERYRDFHRAALASNSPDAEPWRLREYFQKKGEDLEDIWRFGEHLLEPTMPLGEIKQALQLTNTVVALDKEAPSDTGLHDKSENLRDPEPFNQLLS